MSKLRNTPRWPLLLEIARLWKPFEDSAGETGFDPSMHLDELVLLEIRGPARGELVVLRGRFDASRIARFDPANQEGHETRYRRLPTSIAYMVVIGPAETVRAAIDAYLATGPHQAWFDADSGDCEAGTMPGKWGTVKCSLGRRRENCSTLHGGAASGWTRSPRRKASSRRSPKDAQAIASLMRQSFATDWMGDGSHLWKMMGESLRISVDARVVRVTAEMGWEPLLVPAPSRGRF